MKLYRTIKNTLEDIWYPFKYRCQRFIRGYSDIDTFNMYYWFMTVVKPMLVYHRDNSYGAPVEFSENPDGWRNVLDEMIECLNMMDEDNVYEHLGFKEIEDYDGVTIEDIKKVYEIMDKNKNKFFELFGKYFYNLWD